MTRAAIIAAVQADVRSHVADRLRVALRGSSLDLFASLQAARELGAAVGMRLLVSTDIATVAADVTAIDGGEIELQLLAPLVGVQASVTLRRAPHGGRA